jgi:hypothetical protein
MELPHIYLSGMKLDKTAPTGAITAPAISDSLNIILTLTASDATSGVAQMRFSNDAAVYSEWEAYAPQKAWTLTVGDGEKNVFVQYRDNAGLTSTYGCSLRLQNPSSSSKPATSSPISVTQPTDRSPTSTGSSTPEATSTPEVPELNIFTAMLLLVVSSLIVTLIINRRKR